MAVLAIYAPALRADFVNWDDDRFITANPLFHGSVWGYITAAFTRVQFQAYHPLHILSYLPDRLLWPTWAPGFHILNVVIFAAAIVGAFILVRRLMGSWPAALACLLLASHPLTVESVAWVTARKEVLGLFFAVAVLLVEDDDPRSWRRAVLGPVLGLAACLTKTAWVVLPVLVYAWQVYARRRPWRLGLRRALPYAVMAAVLSLPVPFIWKDSQMIPASRPFWLPLDVLGTLGLYVERVVWPHNLSPVYPAAPAGQLAAGLGLSAGLMTLVLLWRRLPVAARFAALTFFGCLVPVSNLIPLYWRFADRYVLPALLALVFPVAALLATVQRRARPGLLLAVAVLLMGTLTTRNLIPAWHDSLALWRRATQVQPDATYGQVKLGEAALKADQFAEAAAAYTHVARADRQNPLGPAGLLKTVSNRAEAEGKLPQGTYAKWQAALTRPGLDAAALSDLIDEAIASPCRSCGPAMLWLGLRLFPQSDANLTARARQAAAQGQAGLVWVLINEMKDRSSLEHTRLGAAAPTF